MSIGRKWWQRGSRPDLVPPQEEAAGPLPVQLVHPFYLDTDMSMAFAAAVSGGVALQSEDTQRNTHESQAVRNIQGNLRAFDLVGIGASRESKRSEGAEIESRFVRQHTEASIFISLHDDLKRTGQIQDLNINDIKPGELVSLTLGPAVAPLRRILEQVMRLFEVAAPVTGLDLDDPQETDDGSTMTRQRRRHPEREKPKKDDDSQELRNVLKMFRAIHEDLNQSGMVDVVVIREDEPSVILSLDQRFASERVLELLHTSKFTVVGKVTEVWPTEDEGVNLYRRSVMSLVPALKMMSTWGLMNVLTGLASGIDVHELRASAFAAAGIEDSEGSAEPEELQLGDITPLLPTVSGPAVQILPLAICA
ncbi:MAG TPA: hypothetical protein VN756_00465 [Solirubrobacterales bacterium]|nr:hypothetical protein [Solirubrobacterales bacterium]